jgi:SAM-dependent methyltransferase
MKTSIKKIAEKLFMQADKQNRGKILRACTMNQASILLDIGCDDGSFSKLCATASGSKQVFGIELVESAAELARDQGIDVAIQDLSNGLPYSNNAFDAIISNQVIEHVPDIDLYMSEISRVLSPNGYAIISTENGSSWINIFASIMGWQQFSLTNMSKVRGGVGNPLALHRGSKTINPTWTHKTIFNYRGLIEFAEIHNLEVTKVLGSGYFPLPRFLANLDARHSHFITIVCQKKKDF